MADPALAFEPITSLADCIRAGSLSPPTLAEQL